MINRLALWGTVCARGQCMPRASPCGRLESKPEDKSFFFFFELLALSACLSKKQKEEEKVAKEDTQGQQL